MKEKHISEEDIIAMERRLRAGGWSYIGCDQWVDPRTMLVYGVVAAHDVQKQREENSP